MIGSKIASADATRKLALNIKVAQAQAMKTCPTVYKIERPKLLSEWISELILLTSNKNLFKIYPFFLLFTINLINITLTRIKKISLPTLTFLHDLIPKFQFLNSKVTINLLYFF